jgi:two-component system, chemotaxis family, CheB/CheR fusion protein
MRIGASAGGFEGLHSFFLDVPADCGMAFVTIRHLPAARTRGLTEVLARRTFVPVIEVTERVEIKPNQV